MSAPTVRILDLLGWVERGFPPHDNCSERHGRACSTLDSCRDLFVCSLLASKWRVVLSWFSLEKRRSPLVNIPPFGRGFSRHGVFRSDGGWAAQERALTPPFIVSMSPPGYPSAWLRPRSARFRFGRQNHCNSATSCRFSTSGLPVTPPEPRPARPES